MSAPVPWFSTPEDEQQRGYEDGYNGRDLHAPMEGPDKLRDAYQEGHERGVRDAMRDRPMPGLGRLADWSAGAEDSQQRTQQ